MDLTFPILALLQMIISAIVTIFLTRLYLRTRYTPTALLAVFFGLVIIGFAITIPIFWIPLSSKSISEALQVTSLVIMILMFPFFVLAFEGMKGRFFTYISTFFIAFTTYILGYIAVIPWTFVEQEGVWWQVTYPDFDTLFTIYIIIPIFLILFRLIQFVREEGTGRSKKMPVIAIFGVLFGFAGGILVYILGIPNIDYLFILVGTVIMASAYILSPNSFFLSNTKIVAIMLLDSSNYMPYLTIGSQKDTDFDLTAAGLGGVMIFLQEILKAKELPTRLIHHDRGFLLEHDLNSGVTGVIIADQINDVLRHSLNYVLSLFSKKFKPQLANWNGEISIFEDFKKDLRTVFSFALPE